VDQAAEAVAATDLVRRRLLGRWRFRERRTLLERAVWTVLVVMLDVGAHDLLELALADDQVDSRRDHFLDPRTLRGPHAEWASLGIAAVGAVPAALS